MDNERMGRMVLRWGQIALAAAGLALVLVPVGIRFTGYFLWGCLGVWLAWELLARWAKRSRTGNICYRVFLCGLTLGVVSLISIECLLLRHGEADNSDIPVDAVIVLGAGVNGETPSAALQSRINAAAAYLQKHPDVPVVLSGGQGPGERITEAEAMRRALWKEDRAENARLLLEDACAAAGVTIVHGAVRGWSIQAAIIPPGSGVLHSIYGSAAAPDEKSALPFTPPFCAAVQAAEAVKLLCGRPSALEGRLLLADLGWTDWSVFPL